jgi:mono/diheme cytochrome c family protein
MNRSARLLLLAGLAALLPASVVSAATSPTHPIVPGFERLSPIPKTDEVRAGRLLLGELNCVSCHRTGEAEILRKQAPILDDVMTRARPGYLRKFLRDPQATKPGTTMPALFATDPERDQKVEALVHFLASTGSLRQARPDARLVAPGRDLYHKVGCVACHGSRDQAGNADKTSPTSVPLGDLKAKYSLAGLTAFLENPLHARPAGRMPKLLDAKEAGAVANYLLQGIRVDLASTKGGTTFAYYEGNWDKLPDFDKLKPVAQGTAGAFDLGVARQQSNFGFKFEGFFRVDRDALYTFTLTSDDGSRLDVDGRSVVDNDGTHPPQPRTGSTRLTKGIHKVTVTFFQASGGAELHVEAGAAGGARQDMAEIVAATQAALEKQPARPKNTNDEDFVEVQPELVTRGRALFASAGCASCHQMKVDGKLIAPSLAAPDLAKLRGQGVCLAPTPTAGRPWYGLSGSQRTALTAALADHTPPSKEPKAVIARTLLTFNCYACHVRDKVGGPDEATNSFFQTTQPEMGEEARVPPPLDGAGAKLNPEYLKHIIEQGSHDRPYMLTHMPAFGPGVSHLAAALGAVDKLPVIPPVTFAEPMSRVKSTARHLVGGQAFGCIKCHTFAGHKAEGVQGIDMRLMPKRLRRDWFHAYVADPQTIRPGTRMPAAFLKGESILPEFLGGKAITQIEAIWLYLQDGSTRPPVGLSGHSIPLVPDKNAILYRGFIEGSGSRAIAVGYPEKAHLAFDANELRLSQIWQGAFLDAARHWTDRGAGFEGPLGDNVLRLHAGAPFAVLTKADAPWPTTTPKEMGYRFKGYRLTPDDRPTFLYTLGNLKVEDFPNAVAGTEPSLRRTLKLSVATPPKDLYFRAAVGDKIESLGQGWYRIDGWKMKIEGDATPLVRQSAGKKELLVPLHFTDGKAQLSQEFVW